MWVFHSDESAVDMHTKDSPLYPFSFRENLVCMAEWEDMFLCLHPFGSPL